MRLFPTTSTAALTALLYITAGALGLAWTGVWFAYLCNNPPVTNIPYYWCAGLAASGLILLLIGLGLGRIGRSARSAEVGEMVQTQVTPGVPGTGVPATAVTTAVPVVPVAPASTASVPAQTNARQAAGAVAAETTTSTKKII